MTQLNIFFNPFDWCLYLVQAIKDDFYAEYQLPLFPMIGTDARYCH